MQNLHLRLAVEADLQNLLQIEQQAFSQERWASERTLQRRLVLQGAATWLAFAGEQAVGFANGFPIRDLRTQEELDPPDALLHDPTSRIWLLRNVAVKPIFQRQGVGKQLIARQLESAKRFGATAVRFTATENLTEYYSAQGFQLIHAATEFHGLPQAIWEKQLA